MSILALTSNTLVGTAASGQIEYDGQFFGTDSNASRAQLQRIVRATAVASTSGTSIDFTGIPAWVERITVMFNEVSTNGTSNIWCQIGSGSVTTSGYVSRFDAFGNSPATSTTTSAFGLFDDVTAASTRSCVITLVNITGNTWVEAHTGGTSVPQVCVGSGVITLSGVLDRVRITAANGTDTFDAGSINIMYEG